MLTRRTLVRFGRRAHWEAHRVRDPLLPPWHLPPVGPPKGYRQVGDEFFGRFRSAGLKAHHSVLDVGCGSGRLARQLHGWLEGSYTGFDIDRPSIDWCQRTYHGFRFVHADIRNTEYNPAGTIDPSSYTFPMDDNTVDFAFATSVFTHLLPDAARRYADELRRVVKPGGIVFTTWFLLDTTTRPRVDAGEACYTFAHEQGGCWVDRLSAPEAAVAYPNPLLAGTVEHGTWAGGGGSYQDIVVSQL